MTGSEFFPVSPGSAGWLPSRWITSSVSSNVVATTQREAQSSPRELPPQGTLEAQRCDRWFLAATQGRNGTTERTEGASAPPRFRAATTYQRAASLFQGQTAAFVPTELGRGNNTRGWQNIDVQKEVP